MTMDLHALCAGVKYRTAAGEAGIAFAPYTSVEPRGDGYAAALELDTPAGRFRFRDEVVVQGEEIFVRVHCTVAAAAEGAAVGLHCRVPLPAAYEEAEFFAPSAWYGRGALFEGKSNKYPLAGGVAGGGIDGLGAPVCAVYSAAQGRAWALEAAGPQYGAALPAAGDDVVDARNALPGIGVRVGAGLQFFYEMPAASYNIAGSGRTVRYWRPAAAGTVLEGQYRVRSFACQSYRGCMRQVWRAAFDRYASVSDGVDTALAREVLLRYVADSFGVVAGVPQYMTRADHFVNESGFLYRNADFAYLILRNAEACGDGAYEKALAVLSAQVERRFAGENQAFPFERSRAEGVYAVWRAYDFLRGRGDERMSWRRFAEQEADRFEHTDEYYSIPLLCAMGRTEAARAKGERIWEKFSKMHFFGGIVDFLQDPVLDRESGYIGMLGFLSLYDATGDFAWAERAAFCADYLETYQNLRSEGFFAYGTCGNEHYNMASVGNEGFRPDGLSFISANCNGADVFNVLAVPLYYRLSVLFGDEHYLRYAELCERNALETVDLANKAGALCDVRLGSGIGFMNEYYQLAVSTDPVGPFTGTAHDADIAWVPYALLEAQQELIGLTGRPFLRPQRCETMVQNIAGDCAFSCGGRELASSLAGGDFYALTPFAAGETLHIGFCGPAAKLVLAHGDMFGRYGYELRCFGGDGQTLSREERDGAARFCSFPLPQGCTRAEISFSRPAVLRQVQVFGPAPAARIRALYGRGRAEPRGEWRGGSGYAAVRVPGGPWDYLCKRGGRYEPLAYDNKTNAWRCAGEEHLCIQTGCLMHPGRAAAAVRSFRIPEDGSYRVYCAVAPAPYLDVFGAKVRAAVCCGGLTAEKTCTLARGECREIAFSRTFRAGEMLYFEIHAIGGNNAHCFVSCEIVIRKENGQ